jgi:hypothetical protein
MSSGNPYQKYIKVNGVSKINPDWKKWQEKNGGQQSSLTKKELDHALPVYCTHEEYLASNSKGDVKLSESTVASFGIIQEEDVVKKIGLPKNEILAAVGAVFSKYEIPLGLLNKLLELQTYDALFFMVDDSGSMGNTTDTRSPQGGWITRWEETRLRLIEMMEIMAHIPTPEIIVVFLNRQMEIR